MDAEVEVLLHPNEPGEDGIIASSICAYARILSTWCLFGRRIVRIMGVQDKKILPNTSHKTGIEKNLFGNHPVSLPETDSRGPPPAFAFDPLNVSGSGGREYNGRMSPLFLCNSVYDCNTTHLGVTTRKSALQVERQNSEASYYADDEDANRKN